jgi:hypothetical protein
MKQRVAALLVPTVASLLLLSSQAPAQTSPSVQLCQVALAEKVSLERGRAQLAVESSESYAISRGIEGVRGKAVLSQRVDLTTLTERLDFNCRVDTSASMVREVTYTPEAKNAAAASKLPAALPSVAPSEHREAVKGCQESIRNRIKSDHGDVNVNFETVETNPIGAEGVGVTGRVRKSKDGDSVTYNYLCRVDATGAVTRGEYAKER